ncbi:holin [Chania multitudinisentens RB-25]|uniref:Holin n=2 Tax=Chania TaxID=1745211 RepID=W0L6M0_9GAMM|nr:holin [Chania multitudinisentens RB-25]
MELKPPDPESVIIWFVIGAFATWGGIVRFLLQEKRTMNKGKTVKSAISQIIVSGFTGVLGGLIVFEYGGSNYMVFIASGIFGSMGDVGLLYIQSYFKKVNNNHRIM